MNKEDIFKGVSQCIASALDMESDHINCDDKLIDDLGADSLDLLDITFRLEQHFSISFNLRKIEQKTQEKLGGEPLAIEGVYTDKAVETLIETMPEIPAEDFSTGLTESQLPKLFRVSTFVRQVSSLLEKADA